jgi:hypothetical protein
MKIKIGISDGNSDGMFSFGADIARMDESPGWKPPAVAEVTEEEWEDWLKFTDKGGSTKSYAQWERFWDVAMQKGWGKK